MVGHESLEWYHQGLVILWIRYELIWLQELIWYRVWQWKNRRNKRVVLSKFISCIFEVVD